jgi:site-specific DNA recombinase
LRNKTYIGEAHFGASVAIVPRNPTKKEVYRKYKKSSRKMKPESEWVKIKVPAIIDVSLFEKARKRLVANYSAIDRNKKNQYLIAGKIWCTCGTRRHGEGPMHGKHLYYRCSSRVYSFPLKTTCEEKGLNARIVDACVWESLSNLMASPQKMQEQIDLWKAKKIQKKNTTNNKDYSREIKQLEEQQKRYTKAYSENVISLDELKEYTLPLKKKIDELKQQDELQKQKVESESSFVAPDYNQIETFAINAKSHLANLGFEEKRSIISSVIDKAVTSKGRVEIYGAIPVNYIENVLFKTVHRNGANTTQHFNDSNGIPFSFEINLN